MEATPAKLYNPQYLLSCLLNFMLMFVHFSLLIMIPIFAMDILKLDTSMAGLLTTAYVFSSMLLRPISAPILSAFGKRGALLIGCGVVLLAIMGFIGCATVVGLIFVMRILNGFGLALQTTALNTAVVDFIPGNRKGEGLGNFSMFMNIAAAAAPIASFAVQKSFGYMALWISLAGLAVLVTIMSYFLQPPHTGNVTQNSTRAKLSLSWRDYFEPRALPPAIFGNFVFFFCYTVMTTFFTVYARKIPAVESYIGLFFIAFSTVLVIVRPFIGRLIDRKGERYVMYPGFLATAIGMFLVSQVESPVSLFAAAACLGLGYSAVFAGTQAACVKSTTADRTGVATITFFIFLDLGFSTGAYFWGIIAKQLGFSHMFLLISGVYLTAILLYYFFVDRLSKVQKLAEK